MGPHSDRGRSPGQETPAGAETAVRSWTPTFIEHVLYSRHRCTCFMGRTLSEALSHFTGEDSDAERISEACSRSQLINEEAGLGTQPFASGAHTVDTRPLSGQSPVRLRAEVRRFLCPPGCLAAPAPRAVSHSAFVLLICLLISFQTRLLHSPRQQASLRRACLQGRDQTL